MCRWQGPALAPANRQEGTFDGIGASPVASSVCPGHVKPHSSL